MAVTYTQILSTDMVVTEVEALVDWQNEILRQVFFPGSQSRASDPQGPSALINWCRREAERGTMDRKMADKLLSAYDDMTLAARSLLEYCKTGAPPTLELFDGFENCVESYITHIRRLQQDLSSSASAVDAVTGLRTVSGMRNDIKREQDRFDRKGTAFSIACIEIDNLPSLQQKYDRRAQDSIYAGVAQTIARTIRSFDDAYYMGKGEYMLVLKHVDFMDACAVMDRMRAELENAPVFLPSGERMRITASFGIAEAVLRENPDNILAGAKSALQEAKASGGNRVAEFREVSALAKFASQLKGSGGGESF